MVEQDLSQALCNVKMYDYDILTDPTVLVLDCVSGTRGRCS